jgi:hypothetical protein
MENTKTTQNIETVAIDDPRNYFSLSDYESRSHFIESMQNWYNENCWALPVNEDFETYWNNQKTNKIENLLDENGNFIKLDIQMIDRLGFKHIKSFNNGDSDRYAYIYEDDDGVMFGLTNAQTLSHDECVELLSESIEIIGHENPPNNSKTNKIENISEYEKKHLKEYATYDESSRMFVCALRGKYGDDILILETSTTEECLEEDADLLFPYIEHPENGCKILKIVRTS